MRTRLAAIMIAVVAGFVGPAHAQANGITRLVTVASIKADNANDDALQGADRQRELIRQQQALRDRQRQFEPVEEVDTQTSAARAVHSARLCRTCVVQPAPAADEDDDDQ